MIIIIINIVIITRLIVAVVATFTAVIIGIIAQALPMTRHAVFSTCFTTICVLHIVNIIVHVSALRIAGIDTCKIIFLISLHAQTPF